MEIWMETVEAKVASEAAMPTGKCTKQLVPIAGKNARFLLNQLLESRYTAGIATKSTRLPGVTKKRF